MLRPLLLFAVALALVAGSVQAAEKNSRVIDRAAMQQVLQNYLQAESEQLPHVDLRFSRMHLPEPFRVPAGRVTHQVVPSRPGVIGSRRLTLMTRVDDRIVSNESVRVELEALAEIAVSARTLRRGTILSGTDFELRYQDISQLKEPVFNAEELIGKRLKRTTRLGEPLEKYRVEFPPLVKRGEQVMIRASSAGLTLTAAGEARQDGRAGETIPVRNSSSRKEILCRVVAPGLVSVEF